jgi:hypothetical protein
LPIIQINKTAFYLGNLQVTLLNQVKIPGTLYQVKPAQPKKSNLLLSAQVCLAPHTNLLNCLALHWLNIKNNMEVRILVITTLIKPIKPIKNIFI